MFTPGPGDLAATTSMIISVLGTIINGAHRDGMIAAARIAASSEMDNEALDESTRRIAREIYEAANEEL